VSNPFAHPSAATRYAKGRPLFHPLVMRWLRERLRLTDPLGLALDVGCGTGLSSGALKEIASRVVGVDASRDMIALAPSDPGIAYLVTFAETLPFRPGTFDLITLSQVIHWLESGEFLQEARRVTRPKGRLVVYDHFFAPIQRELDNVFQRWFKDQYLVRFPSPRRAPIDLQNGGMWRHHGFHLLQYERHESTLTLSPVTLVDYLVTQSNVIAAVEGRREDLELARQWLSESTGGMFHGAAEAPFRFEGPIVLLQRAE
jgi:SAM-dependent methyltransferase